MVITRGESNDFDKSVNNHVNIIDFGIKAPEVNNVEELKTNDLTNEVTKNTETETETEYSK